ncbi:MAG: DUF3365 domain-containing protein [Sandaracinaceae bacterium]|nr:DUF3365 domain-containing protein [Sandaracinaceae bacterium]
MQPHRLFGLLALVALAGCGGEASSEPPAEPVEPVASASTSASAPSTASTSAAPVEAESLARAEAAATQLGTTLRGRLLAAMGEGGPAHAAEVCAGEAAALTERVHTETGVSVGRASLRRRGASSSPAWVDAWLAAQGERAAEGVEGFARLEDGHARVLRPIVIEAPCLACHGETIAPEVAAILDARYPSDPARGYRVGDLRGALWAEVASTP